MDPRGEGRRARLLAACLVIAAVAVVPAVASAPRAAARPHASDADPVAVRFYRVITGRKVDAAARAELAQLIPRGSGCTPALTRFFVSLLDRRRPGVDTLRRMVRAGWDRAPSSKQLQLLAAQQDLWVRRGGSVTGFYVKFTTTKGFGKHSLKPACGSAKPPPTVQPPVTAPCQNTAIALGAVRVASACLRQVEANVWVLEGAGPEGAARVGGLDLATAAGARVTFDRGALTITATGSVTVAAGPVTLYSGEFNWSAENPFTFTAGREARVGGLKIAGEVTGTWTPAGASLVTHVELGGEFGSFTGDVTLTATMADGLVLDGLTLKLDGTDLLLFKRLTLRSAGLAYDRASDTWSGSASVRLPSLRDVDMQLVIQHGAFKSLDVAVSNLNLYLGSVVFLQRLSGGFQRDPLRYSGGAAVTAGPQVKLFDREVNLIEGDAGLSWEHKAAFGSEFDVWDATGALSLATFPFANARVAYFEGNSVQVSGHAEIGLGPAHAEGDLRGWIAATSDGQRFQFEGDASVGIDPLSGGGHLLVSSKGVGACVSVEFSAVVVSYTQELGVSYEWGQGIPGLSSLDNSCDFGRIEVQAEGARAAQAGPVGLQLRGRHRAVMLAVRGQGGAPRITVDGPGTLDVAGPPNGLLRDGRVLYLELPSVQTTYVVIPRPPRGRYSISAQPGSVPIASLGKAEGRPPVRLRASVRGRGGTRVLRWRLRRIAGQTVEFSERGDGVARALTTTQRARGRFRFRPAAGPPGRRRIVALVHQNGRPRKQLTVATYRLRRTTLRRARAVRVRRHGRTLVVRWRHRGAASGFEVRLRLRDGRRLLRVVGPRQRRVTFGPVSGRSRGTATVVARGTNGRRARPAQAHVDRRR